LNNKVDKLSNELYLFRNTELINEKLNIIIENKENIFLEETNNDVILDEKILTTNNKEIETIKKNDGDIENNKFGFHLNIIYKMKKKRY